MIRLDGVERRLAVSAVVPPPPSANSVKDLEVADLNGDGAWEVIYVGEGSLGNSSVIVLSAEDLSVIWKSPRGDLGSFVEIGNVDHDPALEIVLSGGHVYDGSTFAREWSHESASNVDRPDFGMGSYLGDIDGDGDKELVWAGGANHEDDAMYYVLGVNPGVEVEWSHAKKKILAGGFIGGGLASDGDTASRRLLFVSRSEGNAPRIVRFVTLIRGIDHWTIRQ